MVGGFQNSLCIPKFYLLFTGPVIQLAKRIGDFVAEYMWKGSQKQCVLIDILMDFDIYNMGAKEVVCR